MATKVIMPQLGESVVEGTVTAWLKKTGESIQELEALLEVNTDKVDTEIPSPASGIVLKILVTEGTTVKAGTLLAWIGVAGEEIPVGESVEAAAQKIPDVEKSDVPPENVQEPPISSSHELGFISPVVAKLAAEHQVDLGLVKGSGEGGRITKKDVLAFVEKNAAEPEKAAWETPGSGDLFKPTDAMQPDFTTNHRGSHHGSSCFQPGGTPAAHAPPDCSQNGGKHPAGSPCDNCHGSQPAAGNRPPGCK